MISAIGTVITCLSVLGFGYSYGIHLKRERQNLRGMISLTERIRARIECFRQTLPEIYADFSDDSLDNIGFTDDLRQSGMSYALAKNKNALGLGNDVFSILSEFAVLLGKSYADEQLRLCDDCKKKLESRLERIEKDLPSRMRLSLTLSAAVAAMTAILFL